MVLANFSVFQGGGNVIKCEINIFSSIFLIHKQETVFLKVRKEKGSSFEEDISVAIFSGVLLASPDMSPTFMMSVAIMFQRYTVVGKRSTTNRMKLLEPGIIVEAYFVEKS